MHDQGNHVTVKTCMKTDDDVSVYENALGFVESKLSRGSPHAGYKHGMHVWSNQEILHDRGDVVHIVRQYFWSSLAQRLTSRPFLTWSEKAWIGYQIILGVMQAHECGVCHGDIKTENVMLTSWGWVFLVDFLPFKPTWLPKDNPADFSIFFDTSGRRKCCIAPERFISQRRGDELGHEAVRPEMDVFSLGCVLAEVFSDGTSIFEYADLLEFARSKKYPDGFFQGIDSRVVVLIQKMLERDPEKRPCPRECIDMYIQCEGMCAEDFDRLHTICYKWWSISPDERIRSAIELFPSAVDDKLQQLSRMSALEGRHHHAKEQEYYVDIRDIDTLGKNLIRDIRDMLNHGYGVQQEFSEMPGQEDKGQECSQQDHSLQDGSTNTVHDLEHSVLYHNLTVIYCALLRSCRHFSSKIKLLCIIQQCVDLARHTDILLHVVIPHMITAATDVHGRSRTKTYALSMLPNFLSLLDGGACGEGTPASASQVVGDYILPSISRLPHDSDLAVQSQYSCSIGSIGSLSSSIVYYQGAENVGIREEYLERIRGIVERGVHDILVGASSLPKLALLPHLGDITYGIGCQGSINGLLPALLTLFNSRDWNVRASLYMALEHIFPVLGPRALPFILPFVDRLLTDPDIGSLLSGCALLIGLIQARLISTKDVVQINEKVMEIDKGLLQINVVRDYISHLYRVSSAHLGPVASKAMLAPIYDGDNWKMIWKMVKGATSQQKPKTLHVEQDTPFHAEYAADSLEVYTVSLHPVDEMIHGMTPQSTLEQMIDSSQRYGESMSHGPGILLQSPSLRKRQHVEGNSKKDTGYKYRPVDWVPKGIMVARIPCHSKPITQISGNLFKGSTLFTTSSKDGTCKLWDTRRIEKDIQFHPRTTFTGDSGYNCVCESTRGTFVAGREDGILDAWDLGNDTQAHSSWMCGLGGVLDVRYLEQRKICIVSTGAHGVLGVDARAKDPSWTLCTDPITGIPTRVGIDNDCPQYFVTGTSRGFTTVWDMRFLMPVNTWRNPSHAPIESIALTSGANIGVSSSGPVAITASGTDEVSGWDIVSGSCKIVLAARSSGPDDVFVPEALKVSIMDNQKPEDPLGLARQMGASDLRSLSSKRTSVKSVLVTATGKILSGGADKCVRLWDPKDPASSYMIASARDGPSSFTPHYVSQTFLGDTKVIAEYPIKAMPLECKLIWHTGSVTSLMQLQGQKEKLLASASSNGILHVWK